MHDFVAQLYDVIVIGGGTAGCLMAYRLSERASKQVLLIVAREDTPPSHTLAKIDDILPSSTANPAGIWQGLKATVKAGQAPPPYPQGKVMGGETGHVPHGEAPAAFLHRVAKFLAR